MNLPDHKRCLGCGYILDGLPEPRCPECGRAFNGDDVLSYMTQPQSCLPLVVASASAATCELGAVPAAGLARDVWGLSFAVALFVAGLGVHFWVVRSARRLLSLPVAAVKHRLLGLIAGIASALLLLVGCSAAALAVMWLVIA